MVGVFPLKISKTSIKMDHVGTKLDHCRSNPRITVQKAQAIFPFLTMFSTAIYSLVHQNVALCGNGLTLSQTSPGFHMSTVKVF